MFLSCPSPCLSGINEKHPLLHRHLRQMRRCFNAVDTETQGQKGPVKGAASAALAVGQNRLVWGPVGALGTLTG